MLPAHAAVKLSSWSHEQQHAFVDDVCQPERQMYAAYSPVLLGAAPLAQ